MNDIVEALVSAIANVTDFDGDRMASRYTESELRDVARAILPIAAEHFAGVAEGVKYAMHIVEQRSREGDTGAECFNEGCAEAIAAIRASVEPTP